MKNKHYSLVLLVFLFLPIFSISPASAAPLADTSLADIIAAGEITVGIEAAYPPFEDRDPETDEIIGFDPDIMAIIADDIGVDIVWKDVGWDVIFTSLDSGLYDCIISAVTITAEREETMDFSRWYYKSTQAVMVKLANPKNITTIEDVNATTVKVGVQAGTTSDIYLVDNNYTAEMVPFATINLAIEALKLETVDCVLGDYDTLNAGKTSQPDTFEIVDTFSPEDFGIPVQTGSDSLRLRINTILDGLLGEDEDNPVFSKQYNDIYVEWMGGDVFGYERPTIPGFPIIALISILSVASAILVRKSKK
ncbi:MAG: Loki-CTERM sorting domain-containing protein [Promethearchaeota archaeon]